MGIRFRKRLKIAPGVHVNLSLRRGVSVSVGQPGLTHNVGLDGRRTNTVGAPGTGLSFQSSQSRKPEPPERGGGVALLISVGIIGAVVLVSLYLQR